MSHVSQIASSTQTPMLVTNPDFVRPDGNDSPMPGKLGLSYEVCRYTYFFFWWGLQMYIYIFFPYEACRYTYFFQMRSANIHMRSADFHFFFRIRSADIFIFFHMRSADLHTHAQMSHIFFWWGLQIYICIYFSVWGLQIYVFFVVWGLQIYIQIHRCHSANSRSLLQKSPIKKTIFCKRDL